jgi:hypothetical protein
VDDLDVLDVLDAVEVTVNAFDVEDIATDALGRDVLTESLEEKCLTCPRYWSKNVA